MSKVLVDRELLERLMRADADMGREGSASFTLDASDRLDRAWAELRAILAQPEDPEGFEIARHSKRLVEQLRSDLSAVTAERDRLADMLSGEVEANIKLREQWHQLRAEVEALRAENGRLQADRDRANQYANQQALECNKLSTDLEAARGLLRESRKSYTEAIHWEDQQPVMKKIDAFLTAFPVPEVRCQTCDGTGDVHRSDGEWLGECHCVKTEQGERQPAYVECRECTDCGHVGINDAHQTDATCAMCDWSGPSPVEDQCPDCGKENVMGAACPKCSGRYRILAETHVAAPIAQTEQQPVATWMGTDWNAQQQLIAHLCQLEPGTDLYAAPIAQTEQQPEQSGKFAMHQRVRKTSGSEWVGYVCGTYSTALTPEGYAVESEAHAGSVQIYPDKALEAAPEE